jgi:hypothetical protein
MNFLTRHFNLTVALILGLLCINPALAEPLLGLTLLKSTVTDVQNLIAKGGAHITEDKPLFRTGRVIRIQGGSLPGVQEYVKGSFIFNPYGILERYFLNYSLATPGIINERVQAVSSDYGNPKNNQNSLQFATDFGAILFSEDRRTNMLMEDWQVNSMLAKKPAPSGGNRGGSQCANACAADYDICMQPSPIAPRMGPSIDVQQNFAMTQCNSIYNACLNSCPQNR